MYRVDMGSTLVRAITAFIRGGRSRRTLLRDSYLGVNFNDTRTWGCVMWRLVQSVVLIAYCGCGRGADRDDQSTWLRGILGLWGGWFISGRSGRLVALIARMYFVRV